MTVPEAIAHIHGLIAAWQVDEIRALRDGAAEIARDCRLRIATLEQLATDLDEQKAAALTTRDGAARQAIVTREAEQAIVQAVLSAMGAGCFFPVPRPKPGAPTRDLIQWGALRHLHTAIADYGRRSTS